MDASITSARKNSGFSESFPYLLIIAAVYAAVELITGGNYPVFRDEFYYLDCANHLSFGYVDHPPFSILILAIWKSIFGISLLSIRVLPALCGSALIFIAAKITGELGGNKAAQIFTALTVSAPLTYFVVFGFYSMNAFDVVFWALLYLIFIKIINSGNQKFWLWFGLIAGLGLMNKISVGYFGLGVLLAMLCTKERKWFLNKYFWFGGLIAAALFSPYIIWNFANGLPTLEFIRNATEFKNASIPALVFLREQILQINPLNGFVWIAGIIYLFASGMLKKYRALAISYIFVLLILMLSKSKPYYMAAIYPVFLAAGSVAITNWFKTKKLAYIRYAFLVLLIASVVLLSPIVLPILQPADLNNYFNKIGYKPETGEKSTVGALPQYFADRFGWKEMTEQTAAAYNSLSSDEKKKTAIFCRNYGEAGAINYYGKQYGLPESLSGHNSHWLWGYGGQRPEILIVIGYSRKDAEKSFSDVTEFAITNGAYAMPFENGNPIFICRNPKKSFQDIWESVKMFI